MPWKACLLAVFLLGGCAPIPRQVFDMSPIARPEVSAPVRISQNPGGDEDPTVVLARDGRFYVVWSSKRRGRVDLFIRSSRDGRTWLNERRITNTPDEDFYPSLIQSRDGTFHLAWFQLQKKAGRMDIWYARSRNGRRWTRPVRITNHRETDWAPAIYEDASGVLWIMWSSARTGNRELFAARSNDNGRHWSPPHQLTRSPKEDDFPHVLVAPGGERILVWTRYRSGSPLMSYPADASAEIVKATSRDGLRWSRPVTVSPADPAAAYMDFLPFLFPDHNGRRVYVSWTSTRARIWKGDILVRDLYSPFSTVQRITSELGGYDAKIVLTRQPGEYLMVWVSHEKGNLNIFARRFRLPTRRGVPRG
ncbi:MAG: exo-alpha-sialidase [Nitrospiraceae bacterium]